MKAVYFIIDLLYAHIFNLGDNFDAVEVDCRLIGLVGRVFAYGLGDRSSIPGRVIPKTQKWHLTSPCLTLSIIR